MSVFIIFIVILFYFAGKLVIILDLLCGSFIIGTPSLPQNTTPSYCANSGY
jgi:hypothetical protein